MNVILDFLKKHPDGWLTAKEISDKLDLSLNSVKNTLRRLSESGDISFQKTAERGNPIRYNKK
ncbi:HTH domain-containing protein [Candidatus Woesearchaeota archaeon]|nr:HTH domain-containing protein [Candidatus Woesearchaeota archaeon]